MSLLARLNLNYLRIFLVVYRTRSMTLAAKQLHLTQSGVSQQIKSLEDSLGIILFDRINRKIIPTDEAEQLYAECSKRLDELENTLRQISNQENELQGRVKVAISPSLRETRLIELLSDFSRQHPKVKFDLRIGLASELSHYFEKGSIDFAFADAFVNEANLEFQEIASDPYDLVCHASLLELFPRGEDQYESFCRLAFVNYVEAPELLNAWFKKNFGRLPKELNIGTTVTSCHSMAEFICRGNGAGLLPEVQLEELLKRNPMLRRLAVKATVSNRIRLATLRKRTMGLAAKICLQWMVDQMANASVDTTTKLV
ncbi:MAG: LysR family transcriptional regulator [Proteobacteria bacterium]|nr:LysR family transcriptional regulator [Pseudomonadota bacterium]